MRNFITHLLLCNIFLCFFFCTFQFLKWIFKNHLSPNTQYNLSLFLLPVLAVPFFPFKLPDILSLNNCFYGKSLTSSTPVFHSTEAALPTKALKDFAVSVDFFLPDNLQVFLLGIWIFGMLGTAFFFLQSYRQLLSLKKFAFPILSDKAEKTFKKAKKELNIKRKIKLLLSPHLDVPVLAGLFFPAIYLPAKTVKNFSEKELYYILLHELQHYRHKDIFINYYCNALHILYWFNPFIIYYLKELRQERELACDNAVLEFLPENAHYFYGNTLLNFAQTLSYHPFAAGLGSHKNTLKKRILNIAHYHKLSAQEKRKGHIIYFLTALFLCFTVPVFSVFGASSDYYNFQENSDKIHLLDLSHEFEGYEGSFVLYDEKNDIWNIYNKENAVKRIPPNSTYKIYDALLGLESGIITPENSMQSWSGKDYPFEAWKSNQTLQSAMKNSVNWYFQNIDRQCGMHHVKSFFKKLDYGNQTFSSNIDFYWSDFSLKISPVEQVELLRKFNHNAFCFEKENISTVKNALFLSVSPKGALYGKTGTGRVNQKNVNGWFIGFLESSDNTYYFAVNVQNNYNAAGSDALKIAENILFP